MILYGEQNPAPNPRRVRIFIAEKGIPLTETRVQLQKGEHKSPEHVARNSLGQVPTLELDDGTFISESVAICRYLEGLYPDKPLFGRDPKEAALIDMWSRRVELRLMGPLGQYWVNAHPFTARLREQRNLGNFGSYGEYNRDVVYPGALKWFNADIAGREFIAGDAYSMADILAQTTIDFAKFMGLELDPKYEHIAAWHKRVSARPSADA